MPCQVAALVLFAVATVLAFAVVKPVFAPGMLAAGVVIALVFLACVVASIVLGLGDEMATSFIPKSVTTTIAIAVSEQLGGITSITVAAVIITGILGAIFAPLMSKIFRVNNRIAKGVAIGTCSHAVGTTKALEMGELEGAMSGVSIAVSGLLTTTIVIIASCFV